MSQSLITDVEQIHTIAVLGAGTMGHGVAQVAAMSGFKVVMRDLKEEFLTKAVAKITQNLDKGVARNKVSKEVRDQALASLTTTTDVSTACCEAQMVIEAAPESIDLKREIFAEVVASAPAGALLASNTSSLSIAKISSSIPQPERVVGMHFFNPVHIMKLVEVVRHEGTDPGVVACVEAVAKRFGKTPIVVKDTPGFASSRLGLVIGLEAMRMFEQGVASAEDIDTAMKLGYGHPMGPLELTDLVGLDVRLSIAEYLSETVSAGFVPPQVLKDKVAAGKLGKKTGEGFYQWIDGKIAR